MFQFRIQERASSCRINTNSINSSSWRCRKCHGDLSCLGGRLIGELSHTGEHAGEQNRAGAFSGLLRPCVAINWSIAFSAAFLAAFSAAFMENSSIIARSSAGVHWNCDRSAAISFWHLISHSSHAMWSCLHSQRRDTGFPQTAPKWCDPHYDCLHLASLRSASLRIVSLCFASLHSQLFGPRH